tara:strand:- start:1943 stop:2407 length:465 start_codon:yes stop_codon:yes gene_type:complete
MPKPKPDNVVRHEIVLGRAERQIIRDAQTAYSINRIATPITNMSGSGFIVAGGAAIIVIDYILDHLGLDPDWREIIEDMTPEQVTEWLESQKLQIGGLIALVNPIFGLPLVAAGVAGVVDDVVDEAARQREEQQTKSFASWGIGFRRFIRGGGF